MRKRVKDFFIPHEGNDYKPHSLQKAAVLGMLGMVLLSFTITNIQSLVWISSQWMVSAILPSVIVDLTNVEREKANLGTLRRNANLDEAAQLKAEDMAKYEYFAHYSPSGVAPWFWFGEVSYNFVNAGENLAIHFTDSKELVDAWMTSPTHRANIMNGNYTEIGIGTAQGTYEGFQTVYVVQFLGTPAAPVSTVAGESVVIDTSTELAVSEVLEVNSSAATSTETEVLAESVSINETIEIIEAESVPVEIVTYIQEEEAVIAPTSETEVVDIDILDDRVVLYSSFISTSTGGVPAIISPSDTETVSTVPFLLGIATQPQSVLQAMYILIGGFVFIVLMLSVLVEVRRQEPLQIAYSIGLLVLMYGLFQVHIYLSSGVLIV